MASSLGFRWSPPLRPNCNSSRPCPHVSRTAGAARGRRASHHTLQSESLSGTVQLKSGAWLSLDSSRSRGWRLRSPRSSHEAALATRGGAPRVTSVKLRETRQTGTVTYTERPGTGRCSERQTAVPWGCLSVPQRGAQPPQLRGNTVKVTFLLPVDALLCSAGCLSTRLLLTQGLCSQGPPDSSSLTALQRLLLLLIDFPSCLPVQRTGPDRLRVRDVHWIPMTPCCSVPSKSGPSSGLRYSCMWKALAAISVMASLSAAGCLSFPGWGKEQPQPLGWIRWSPWRLWQMSGGTNNAWKKSNHPVRKTWTSESGGGVFARFSLRLLQTQCFQGSSVEVVTSPQSWPTHWISPEAGISEVMITFEFCFPSVSLGSLGSSAQDGA